MAEALPPGDSRRPGASAVDIRDERPGDAAAIAALVSQAFREAAHSDGTEAVIVEGLRASRALTVGLVAAEKAGVLGHIAFSPVVIEGADAGWYGLGPVAVSPAEQRRGIGSALVRAGLERLKRTGAAGCVVLGDPAFYARFGFAPDPALVLEGVPPGYFRALRFSGAAAGRVTYHRAFYPE